MPLARTAKNSGVPRPSGGRPGNAPPDSPGTPGRGPGRARRTAHAALLLATLTTLTATASPAPAAPSPTDRTAPLEGVWRTDGYGTLVTIEGRRLRTYETTAVSCLPGSVLGTRTGAPGPHGRSVFTVPDGAPLTVTPAGAGRARMSSPDAVGHRTLHRVGTLPGRCRRPAARDPRAVFGVYWQTFAENYPFFRAKKIDWAAVRDRYRPRITATTSDDELFAVLREMIEPLHDAHTRVVAGPDQWFAGKRPGTVLPTPGFTARIDKAIAANLGPGVTRRSWAQGKIAYAGLPDRVGYLRVTQFARYTQDGSFASDAAELDRALDAVFTRARTQGPGALRGLIVDLRLNGGGYDPLGLRIASRLTDRPYLAYAKRARNDPHDPGKFTTPEPVRVRPHRGPVFTGPVAVLTGRLTISAGETFTQSLMGRSPAPVRIGENTQGVFSDILERALPGTWQLGLPNEEFLTAGGRTFDGPGIPPAIRTPVFADDDLDALRDPALTRARALLSGRATATG
ncbi:S41 family peptidase [Streptomyces pinistramenti]|uniref:S41 family peptidase n=1 Tax=Streptomyces pinistramenti TaxID=2884812 RepID=UPI001D06A9B6|nr:S41 family peptidase [Streptomyces pinistramenti]MCB5909912.1 S41 family peptidase [Streptomyces pinistramenti]